MFIVLLLALFVVLCWHCAPAPGMTPCGHYVVAKVIKNRDRRQTKSRFSSHHGSKKNCLPLFPESFSEYGGASSASPLQSQPASSGSVCLLSPPLPPQASAPFVRRYACLPPFLCLSFRENVQLPVVGVCLNGCPCVRPALSIQLSLVVEIMGDDMLTHIISSAQRRSMMT